MIGMCEQRFRRKDRLKAAREAVIDAAKRALWDYSAQADLWNATNQLINAEADYTPEKIAEWAEKQLRPKGACL